MVLVWDGVTVYSNSLEATSRGLLDMEMEYARREDECTMLGRLDLCANVSACGYNTYGPAPAGIYCWL